MYIFITLAVLPHVARFVSCESTKEPPKDIQAIPTYRIPVSEVSTSAPPSHLASLWTNRPSADDNQLQQGWGDSNARYKILLRAPHSLTKLAKTLTVGFNPSISMDYFEPFERRQKPVTLVAFRKNGFALRHVVKLARDKSSEIAELQSPYNEVSNFWQNEQMDVKK